MGVGVKVCVFLEYYYEGGCAQSSLVPGGRTLGSSTDPSNCESLSAQVPLLV